MISLQTKMPFDLFVMGHLRVSLISSAQGYPLMGLLRSEIRAACAQSFAPWQQATIEITRRDHSIIACSRHIHNGVILHAHPIRGESHNQRNTTGEVATTSPPFCNEPHRSHVLCVKAELDTTSTSWSQHHFVAIGNPERHVRKASHRGSKQQ